MNEKKDNNGCTMLAAEISWMPRYSFTEQPDEQGRWARMAMFRSLKIAWINMMVMPDGEIVYHLDTFFPTSSNDLPFSTSTHKTFIEAKRNAENLWLTFLNHCR